MGLSDVAGVFSRPFIVGFFLPVFSLLVLYSVTVGDAMLPDVYREHSEGTRIAVLGGTGLILALLLLGLNYPILRLFEGYPLVGLVRWLKDPRRHRRWAWPAKHVGAVADALVARQASRMNALRELRATAPPELAGLAAWQLDRCFPRKQSQLLPTSFGNAVRAFETHSVHRWGLDAIAAEPRIAALRGEHELTMEADARSEVAFFVNFALAAVLLWPAWIIDGLFVQPVRWSLVILVVTPPLVAYAMCRAAIGAAQRWGSTIRAGIDLHRLELYEQLGVAAPTDFTHERLVVGPAVSRCLLHGNRLPDALYAVPEPKPEKASDDA